MGSDNIEPQASNDFIRNFSVRKRRAAKVRNHAHGHMNVHHLVQRIRNAGVTPDMTVVVWATNYRDLSSFRDWFKAQGYSNILPPDSNCVTMVQTFRLNIGRLSDGRSFPLRLKILFSLFYGSRHELSGRNHHALVDAQQTRLMLMRFMTLCSDSSTLENSQLSIDSEIILQRTIPDFFAEV